MELEGILLREISQTEKEKYSTISHGEPREKIISSDSENGSVAARGRC